MSNALEANEVRLRKMEDAVKAAKLKAETVQKREIDCSQRELACELLLENETKRIQELHATLQAAYQQNCHEHRRQIQIKENHILELNCRLESVLTQKAEVEQKLVQNEKASDDRLFEAFRKLKEIITNEQDKKKKMEILIVSKERRYLDMLEKEEEQKRTINSMQVILDKLQAENFRLQHENQCLREKEKFQSFNDKILSHDSEKEKSFFFKDDAR